MIMRSSSYGWMDRRRQRAKNGTYAFCADSPAASISWAVANGVRVITSWVAYFMAGSGGI
jgi:hypothetical protein